MNEQILKRLHKDIEMSINEDDNNIDFESFKTIMKNYVKVEE